MNLSFNYQLCNPKAHYYRRPVSSPEKYESQSSCHREDPCKNHSYHMHTNVCTTHTKKHAIYFAHGCAPTPRRAWPSQVLNKCLLRPEQKVPSQLPVF